MATAALERIAERLQLRPHFHDQEIEMLREDVFDLCREIRSDQDTKCKRLHGTRPL